MQFISSIAMEGLFLYSASSHEYVLGRDTITISCTSWGSDCCHSTGEVPFSGD